MSHYKPYPSYKDSGIDWLGEVPEAWKVTRLKYVSELNPKKSSVEVEREELCTFLPMEKLKTDSIVLDETRVIEEVYDGYSYFENGDILIAKVTPCFENKNIAIADDLVNGVGFGSTEINAIRSNEKSYNRFLYYRLQEEQFRKIAINAMTGTGGLKRVPSEIFQTFKIAIPSYDEQKRIAEQIDQETIRIDTLIAKKTRFIELLKEKRQALITYAVTKGLNPDVPMKDSSIEWIGDVPEHWGVGKLKHLGSLKGGAGFPTELQGKPDNELPFYKVGDLSKSLDGIYLGETIHTVSRGEASNLGAKVFPEDTIAWAKIGAALLLNRRRITKNPSCLDNNMTGFIVSHEKAFYKYAFYLMCSIDFDFYVRPGAVPSLSEGEQSAIPMPIPPIDEQKVIAEAIDRKTIRIDTLIAKAQHSIELLKERRSAFITAAVTGQIDVCNHINMEHVS